MHTEETIERAKARDPKALNELYAMWQPKMIGVCRNIIKDDENTARDLVHDAFVLAFAHLDRLRDNSKFGEWLTTIVRNVALKHIARRGKMHFVTLNEAEAEGESMANGEAADAEVMRRDLIELINLLPDGYGNVFRLSVIEGFSHNEIATMLGIKPHSSSSQLARAKAMLRGLISRKMIVVAIALAIALPLFLHLPRHNKPAVDQKLPTKKRQKDVGERLRSEPTVKRTMAHSTTTSTLPDYDGNATAAQDTIVRQAGSDHAGNKMRLETTELADNDTTTTLPQDSCGAIFRVPTGMFCRRTKAQVKSNETETGTLEPARGRLTR